MKNKTITSLFLVLGTMTFAQVGFNTPEPKVTVDIVAKSATGTTTNPEGLLIPRVDRQKAQSMKEIPVSTLIFVDNVTTGSTTGIATNIYQVGFYYFDGERWVRLNFDPVLYAPINLYNTDGTLEADRVVTQNDKKLAFTSTANNAFSIDGDTFSVDAKADRVGIGTIAPAERLDISGAVSVRGRAAIDKTSAGTFDYGLGQTRILSWGDTTSGVIGFWTGAGGKPTSEKMRIHSDGNVGINTNAPKAKLDIIGSTFGLRNSVGSWDNIWFDVNNTSAPSINASGAETGLQFKVGKNATGTYGDENQSLITVATMSPDGNIGIGTVSPANSAILELNATNKGFLPPRLTTAQRDALNPKPAGLMVYNVNTNCMEFWNSASWVSTCAITAPPVGVVTTLNCGGATHNGTILTGTNASVSSVIPYDGGNGGTYGGQTIASTGVTGLTATLTAGNFDNGAGSLTYTITGTPSGAGTANFVINIGGQACTLSRTVSAAPGSVLNLNCGGATNNGTLTSETLAAGVSSIISYTGGNGGTHNGQVVNSTGVVGLTATLAAGNFANGSGNLTYTITGTPTTAGTAYFTINIGGQTCILSRIVNAPTGVITNLDCASVTRNGNLQLGAVASNVSFEIPYTGGNGGAHNGQTVTSTGVTGLTATLSAGNFNATGTLTYIITGTPSAAGTANFAINIGGKTCIISVGVLAPCTAEGVYAYPHDVRKYYRCIRIGGDLYRYIYTCPNGSVFDPIKKICVAQ
ncbi:Chitin binding Peritrophin-A domain-containing protein [Chryseobacterium wanjuense]|uniref:Chitin binding Peritrophin-A domain-containing protein n=1 Tax=Chryseobacterium wanjuense TaxID=356305 RepID=A0A1I0NL58_9FLAO|nr:chitin binding peritrophin-A domain-containing protein [Chryseobacterium wanjuense]SEW02052.1 Chitin binding Peritrophin-A domain-containing protein [Chryseobacterium wanjuense]